MIKKRNFLKVMVLFALTVCLPPLVALASGSPVKHTFTVPESIVAGEEFEVNVTFDIEDLWHIYAPTGNNEAQGMIETKVTLLLPEGIKTQGELQVPSPHNLDTYEVLTGKVKLTQKLQAIDNLEVGEYTIKGRVRYQACNHEHCLPPTTKDIRAVLVVK